MESRVKLADERHRKGYNCAQAVACTYCDLVGIDEATMFKLTEGLGLGMGCMEGTCGAVSGACVLAGAVNSSGDLEHPTTKAATYGLSRQIVAYFAQEAGTIRCRDLKGVDTGVVRMPCPVCIAMASEIVEHVLFPNQFEAPKEV